MEEEQLTQQEYVKTWFENGRRAAHSTTGMSRQISKKGNYYETLWKIFK